MPGGATVPRSLVCMSYPPPLRPGHAAVIVPLVARDPAQLHQACAEIAALPPGTVDLVEWRLDRYAETVDSGDFASGVEVLRSALPGMPVLGCYRTPGEEGQPDLRPSPPADSPDHPQRYAELVAAMAQSGIFSLVDVEFRHSHSQAALAAARDAGTPVVLSEHDFTGARSAPAVRSTFVEMAEAGGSVAKLAVMPQSAADVTALMHGTAEAATQLDIPLIAIAMGPLGTITRIAAPGFGSCASYCTVGAASAPGQVPATQARPILDLVGAGT